MARSLSSMVFKGIARSMHVFNSKVWTLQQLPLEIVIQLQLKVVPLVASGSVFQQGMQKYSIKTSGDSDTHEDFRPTNNLENSDISVDDVVRQDVKENTVMIYMKGLPEAPQCGFSALAVKVLQQYGIPISARNILEDPELKEGIKSYSNWPTFPQIFVKGEFIGGSDIILNMHKNGELKELLMDVKHDNSKA